VFGETGSPAETLLDTRSTSQMELAYSALSRAMLLLSSAATAAADYDEKHEVQDRVSIAIRDAYTRASSAISEAQATVLSTSESLRSKASALYERATQLDLSASAREALKEAEGRVTAFLDAAPEGSIVASTRDALVIARAELSDVRRAWDEGAEDGGMVDAASAAIASARSKLETAGTAALESAGKARDDALETARLAAMATLSSARERVELARSHMEFVKERLTAPLGPAMEEAAELGRDGVARLQGAAMVLARAAENVAVEAAAMGDRASGCSGRVSKAWKSLDLDSVLKSAQDTAGEAMKSPAVAGALSRVASVDESVCCGNGSRMARGGQRALESLWAYGEYFVGRVKETKDVLQSMDEGYDLKITKEEGVAKSKSD
jgi:hypothetical protein